jgi:MYXO-CTERM domain-containing protein
MALVLLAPPTAAFCRITTIETVTDGEDLLACYDTSHPPVWWRSACLGLSVESGGSKYASAAVVDAILFQSVLPNWMNADCPGGGHPSIEVVDLGPVECDQHQANLYGPNANEVIFHDDAWPYDDGAGCTSSSLTVALTTVTFHPETGELWDADIEINSACFPLSTTLPVPAGRYDLQSILQHETGHYLGLAHPPDPEAIMYYLYSPGSDGKRKLDSDDIAGACTIYPPSGERSDAPFEGDGGGPLVAGLVAEGTCDPTPRNGFSSPCVPDAGNQPPVTPAPDLTCRASPTPSPSPGPIHALFGVALLAGAVRARRRVGS